MGAKLVVERFERSVDVELDALQEQAGGGVGMLIGLDDVAAGGRDERADRGHDPGPVRALEEEHGAHGRWPSEELQGGIDVAAELSQVDLDARDALALRVDRAPGA